MNRPPKKISAALLGALLATLLLPTDTFAQPKSPARWLFVFDLSSAMKKRLPATEDTLKNFLATRAEGRLQSGDNVGVWTYDQKLHTGQFPTTAWNPQQTVTLTTNLTAFLNSRTFTGGSQLAALQPTLGSVISSSERLTIIIFCDGESEISGTPYDLGINQSFLDGHAERKKNAQPFVVLIRTLSGKNVGCTVNFPPGAINIPLFLAPTPPAPATNPPPTIVAPVKPAPVVVPDLIINGNNVGGTTNPPPSALPMTNPPPVADPKIVVAPATNPVFVPAPAIVKTSPPTINPVATTSTAITTAPTNAANIIANTNASTDQQKRHPFFIVVGLLAVAGVVLLIIFRPGRRPQTSLISSSMQDGPRRK